LSVLFRLMRRAVDIVSVVLLAALPLVGLLLGPIYAALAWVLGGLRLVGALALRREAPVLDWTLAVLAAGFSLACLMGALWSIVPAHTLGETGQLAAILAASLVVIADRSMPSALASRVFGAFTIALIAGVAILVTDHVLHYWLERHLTGKAEIPGTKYNRGEDYLTLLMWPSLAYWWLSRRKIYAALVVGAVCVAAIFGLSTTARVILPASFATFLAASLAARGTRRLMALAVIAMAATLPFLLRMLARDRALLWHRVKESGLHRLEIWDYMTARVLERPLAGWGLGAAKYVPIRPAEQASYVFVKPSGIYPHQQWLQLWLETGAAGVVLGTLFALLVLHRIGRLPPRLAPFALATFTAAIVLSFSSFEITTDSWWAALALTTLLFRLAAGAVAP